MTELRESLIRWMAFAFVLLVMVSLGFVSSVYLRSRAKVEVQPVVGANLETDAWPQPTRLIPPESISLVEELEVAWNQKAMIDEAGRRFTMISFDSLSGARWDDQGGAFPKAAMDLDGESVMLLGFMVPLDLEEGKVSRFLLTQNINFCSKGGKPRLDQIVVVDLDGMRVPYRPDQPVAVCGVMKIGAFMDLSDRPFLFHLEEPETFEAKTLLSSDG